MKKIIRLSFLLSMLLTITLTAQKTSLFLAGRTLKLGMNKDEIRKDLSKYYEIVNIDATSFAIIDNNTKCVIGEIGYENNIIQSIDKEWTLGNTNYSEVSIMTVLFNMLNTFEKDYPISKVHITTNEISEPTFTMKSIILTLDKNWSIGVHISNNKVQIKEIIEDK